MRGKCCTQHDYGVPALANTNNALQDGFLTALEMQAVAVTVFLVNGVRLNGHVVRHDLYSLALRRDAHTQLVAKPSISTIMPQGDFTL